VLVPFENIEVLDPDRHRADGDVGDPADRVDEFDADRRSTSRSACRASAASAPTRSTSAATHGARAARRAVPVRTLEELGAPAACTTLLNKPYGIVLVVGPTGSGKSTTLAAMIDKINDTKPVHILTIEDPVEYLHNHKTAMVNQREVGTDVGSFTDGLRSALREDPDVVLLGEMRDLDSIQIALSLAETGHLVMASLHTNDAAQALDRIIDVFPAEKRDQIQTMLAGSLQGVVSQRLLPGVNGGRVAAYEVLMGTEAVRNLMREGKSRQLRNVVATGAAEGMQTIEMDLARLVSAGLITMETAKSISAFPSEIQAQVSTEEAFVLRKLMDVLDFTDRSSRRRRSTSRSAGSSTRGSVPALRSGSARARVGWPRASPAASGAVARRRLFARSRQEAMQNIEPWLTKNDLRRFRWMKRSGDRDPAVPLTQRSTRQRRPVVRPHERRRAAEDLAASRGRSARASRADPRASPRRRRRHHTYSAGRCRRGAHAAGRCAAVHCSSRIGPGDQPHAHRPVLGRDRHAHGNRALTRS
jgi:pilus retraction protein PilT